MAERRMLAKSIVTSDEFLDMPAEAKALYFMLNMAADDDGFCGAPRSVMRQCQVSDDAMKVLVAKKFVLIFPKPDDASSYVLVIKHWRVHNYIRKDTYQETKYKELMQSLYLDENKAYSENPGDDHVPVTARRRHVDDPSTQDRIGKDSIGKFSIDHDSIVKGVQGENPEPTISDTQESSAEKNNSSVISSCIPEERKKYWKDRIIKAKTLYPAMIPGLIRIAGDEGIIINEDGETAV